MEYQVRLNDLHFKYPKGGFSLRIPDFRLKQNERLFIKGPSGSGKSTFLNLVSGVLKANSGEIFFRDENMSKKSSAQWDLVRGEYMGFIFQQFNLLPYFNALENVILSCEFSKKKKIRCLSSDVDMEARHFLKSLNLSEAQIHQKVSQLSVGQQQRVAAARALMGQPELIIADEPTSALDYDLRDQFISQLIKQCEISKTALLFVSHDPSISHHFDRVVDIRELVDRRSRARV